MAVAAPRGAKHSHNIDVMLDRIREAVRPYPRAALFELADLGFRTPFQLLVACIISIRTRDETTLPVARGLLQRAPDPAAMAALTLDEIGQAIRSAAFHERKARSILAIARRAVEKHGGKLPCDFDVLVSLPGVGPKCANLVLGAACGQPRISVDVHVHRVTNRWGYVAAATPDATLRALEQKLPRRHWTEINRLLVPFGKHIFTGRLPRCSTCPVLEFCHQVGVVRTR